MFLAFLILLLLFFSIIAFVGAAFWMAAVLAVGAIAAWIYGIKVLVLQGVLRKDTPKKPPHNPDIFPIIPDP